MRVIKRASLALVLPLFVVLATACQDDPVAPGAQLPDELRNLDTGIHPVLSIPQLNTARVGEPVSIRVHLRQVNLQEDISSFQGEILFDAQAIQITDGTFPEEFLGAWNEVSPGVIRFAGVSLEGVGDGAAFVLTGKTLRPFAGSGFQVNLEEVVAAEAFVDLTDRVVLRDKALVTDHDLVTGAR